MSADPMNDPTGVRIERITEQLAGVTQFVRAQTNRIAELEGALEPLTTWTVPDNGWLEAVQHATKILHKEWRH